MALSTRSRVLGPIRSSSVGGAQTFFTMTTVKSPVLKKDPVEDGVRELLDPFDDSVRASYSTFTHARFRLDSTTAFSIFISS